MVNRHGRLFTRGMDLMHDIENGHDCPRCGKNSICTIEDGFCENGGDCDNCIKENYRDLDDDWAYEYDDEHDYDEDCDCDICKDEREFIENA